MLMAVVILCYYDAKAGEAEWMLELRCVSVQRETNHHESRRIVVFLVLDVLFAIVALQCNISRLQA